MPVPKLKRNSRAATDNKPKLPPNEIMLKVADEIGIDNLLYIMNHHGKQKRSVTAKKTGIAKMKLNEYYMELYGKEGA